MKYRILSLILVFALFLSGCSFWQEQINQSVTFHYLCKNYQTDLCCVIGSEERESSGHKGDLPYLLALYLMGPTNDAYMMPLPGSTHISIEKNEGHITLTLSDTDPAMSDLDFSLACACLTMTTLEITDAEAVTVLCGDREVTMNQDSLTLYDVNSEPNSATEESS